MQNVDKEHTKILNSKRIKNCKKYKNQLFLDFKFKKYNKFWGAIENVRREVYTLKVGNNKI